ncbi:hypothetical protein LXA43DRAFT_293671 [Ganoderma leucocontextum]|nr:hypothetical protein LXA43DRAFT_293671 [Ganoderma leucocontextum]
MSASSVDKPAKKHRKHKDPPPEVDRQEGEGEPKPRRSKKAKTDKATRSTPVAVDVAESTAELSKETPRKKRKNGDREDVPGPQQRVEEPKKKNKKHKHEEEAAAQVDGLQTEDDSGRKKKKRRKEAAATEDGEQGHQQEGEGGDEADGDHGIDDRPPSSKKEKKRRKQSHDEGEKAVLKEKTKKKRKRSSSSGFPNPSEDESLSEQGRKALEYAFVQFEDPGSWKFHKARQNWLLRNIWSDDAVPETYMPLATRYLQGVQGGAREVSYVFATPFHITCVLFDETSPQTLIKSCREAVELPKPAASKADTAENEEMPPKSSEADDPTTQRTVKFTVDEEDERNTPSATDDTKRQRAASLLTALTS